MAAPDSGKRIVLAEVGFAYNAAALVLDGVTASLGDGVTLVVGPNGAGKSTLLRMVAGVERPQSGSIRLDGHDLWRDEVQARQRLVYIPEQPDLSPYATLRETLLLVCRLRGVEPSRIDEVLERAGLVGLEGRSVRELSMGQRRRCLLAAAWIGEPAVAVLDEPLEAMDRSGREQIVEWVGNLRTAGAAILLATHEIEPFVPLADRVLTLRRGILEETSPLEADFERRWEQIDRLARGTVC